MLSSSGLFVTIFSPYLPLKISPEIERQTKRVLILDGRAVMGWPIAAPTVFEAFDDAREKDEEFCDRFEAHMMIYTQNIEMTHV
ncbi:MAG: hypothetical protein JW944_04585 [Deltaproteobacteria bacterium]|nr:hypothetical protein [Deltaproteobacteria bacterium]